MPLHAPGLRRRLGGLPPKAVLALVLVAGFAATVPFWLSTTEEDRQRMLSDTATQRMVEQAAGVLDLSAEDTQKLKRMLKREPEAGREAPDFEREVWVRDLTGTIRPWVASDEEAETIARWVYTYSVRFDLSPELVLAVIAVESQFDHFAVSNVGAIGLMQVMPFWKERLGSPEDNLLDVETNIRYGCAILRYYLDRYKSLDRALAAYNGSLGDRSKRYASKIYATMKRFKASRVDI